MKALYFASAAEQNKVLPAVGSYLSDINVFIILLVIGIISLSILRRLLKFQSSYVIIGLVGLLIGLVLGDLLGSPLSQLARPWGLWVPIIVRIAVAAALLDFALSQAHSWTNFFGRLFSIVARRFEEEDPNQRLKEAEIIVDTSAFIDGRIEQLAETRFILGKLIIPRFVLDEMQKISDLGDDLKRARGRRGLDVISRLSKNPHIKTEIIETDFKERQADKKLVKLAKVRHAQLLTSDYNLNRVAEISGIEVLNINELANALKPIVLPGEMLKVKVVAAGKEKGQGVGYLPDGTMIVVEDGEKFVGKEIDSSVERIYQTVAGKMIFVKPR
ncbi:MAG: hypothetical protein NT135_03420 [Candidatus Berkelbacteria bacterium]|nr:hypothetical protein [Candidatus Berkelbacteria bacterium]